MAINIEKICRSHAFETFRLACFSSLISYGNKFAWPLKSSSLLSSRLIVVSTNNQKPPFIDRSAVSEEIDPVGVYPENR